MQLPSIQSEHWFLHLKNKLDQPIVCQELYSVLDCLPCLLLILYGSSGQPGSLSKRCQKKDMKFMFLFFPFFIETQKVVQQFNGQRQTRFQSLLIRSQS